MKIDFCDFVCLGVVFPCEAHGPWSRNKSLYKKIDFLLMDAFQGSGGLIIRQSRGRGVSFICLFLSETSNFYLDSNFANLRRLHPLAFYPPMCFAVIGHRRHVPSHLGSPRQKSCLLMFSSVHYPLVLWSVEELRLLFVCHPCPIALVYKQVSTQDKQVEINIIWKTLFLPNF